MLILDDFVVNSLTVVVIVKLIEIFNSFNILWFHFTAVFHILAEQVNKLVALGTNLAESHCIIEESAVIIVCRKL